MGNDGASYGTYGSGVDLRLRMAPARIRSDREWLAKHLQPLMDTGRNVVGIDASLPGRHAPSYDRGYWTGLKLIALKYYLPTYLNILARRTRVGYVDFFAGPGLNRIGKRKVALPGSPLIPLVVRETDEDRFFSHLFYCEANAEYAKALRKRVAAFIPNGCETTFYEGDANRFVTELPDLVKGNGIGHVLVFVDPEGLEWHWSSMEKLAGEVRCDVIVNFPSAGLQRLSTRRDLATRQTLAKFLGIALAELPHVVDAQWAIATYRANLASLGKDISTEIMITDYGPYHYHLIPAVTRTTTGAPWFRAFLQLRERVERLHGEILNLVAQQIDGELGVL